MLRRGLALQFTFVQLAAVDLETPDTWSTHLPRFDGVFILALFATLRGSFPFPRRLSTKSFPCAAEFSYQFLQLKERWRVRLVSSPKICHTDLSLTADVSTDHDIVLCHGFMGIGGLPTGSIGYFNGVEKDLKDRGCRVYAPWVSMVATIDHRAEQLHKKIDTYLRDTYGSSKDRPVHLICQSFPHFAYNS